MKLHLSIQVGRKISVSACKSLFSTYSKHVVTTPVLGMHAHPSGFLPAFFLAFANREINPWGYQMKSELIQILTMIEQERGITENPAIEESPAGDGNEAVQLQASLSKLT